MIRESSLLSRGSAFCGIHLNALVLGIAFTCWLSLPTCAQVVGNDLFSGAFLLSGATGSTNGSNVGATVEPGEPVHAGVAGGSSVWYRWAPSLTGPVVIDTVGSGFDTLLGIYIGESVTSLSLVVSNDDIAPAINPQSRVTFMATAGTVYRIAVDGFAGTSGPVVLNWNQSVGPPANDNFTNAIALNGASGTINGDSFNGTKEPLEPNHAGNAGGSSIWYKWTALSNGPVTFNSLGSTFDTVMGIYTGNNLNSLAQAGANDDATPSVVQSQVTFTAIAGTVYRIAVDGYGGASGIVKLSWRYLTPPHFTTFNFAPGQTQMALAGQAGDLYEVQQTTNYVDWDLLAVVTNINGTVQYVDPSVGNGIVRFYRARIVP